MQGEVGAAPTKSSLTPGLGGGWSARSEGISGPVTHTLKTFSIGIQMLATNGSPINLANDIHTYTFAGAGSDQAGGALTVPAGEVLIGGGFATNSGTFAVDAYASGMLGGTWRVNAKRFAGSSAKVNGQAITLSRCLPSANPRICLDSRKIFTAVSADGTFLQGASATNDSSRFLVGVGAISSSWSRPIWGMFPLPNPPAGGGTAFAFTVAPGGDLGHVTAQALTIGF